MKHIAMLLGLIAIAPLCAQSSIVSATTATDFGVLASDGANTNLDSKARNTPIGHGLAVHAGVGGSTALAGAFATTMVMSGFPGSPNLPLPGWTVRETGRSESTDANATLAAGTSADAPGVPTPTQAAHAVAFHYAVPPNVHGGVLIQWNARATGGANVAASIDLDGDGQADWTGSAAAADRQIIPVISGAHGIDIVVSTNGALALTGVGREGYDSVLGVAFVPRAASLGCTWTSFGPPCVGSLLGSDAPGLHGLRLTLSVRGATPSTAGFLVFGTAATTPTPLPGGVCDLLIDRNSRTFFVGGFHTDANGDAITRVEVPARAFTIDMQALTFDRANQSIGSTNGLDLVCH